MSLALVVDPGLRGCGVSVFKDRVLTHVDYVKNPVRSGDDAEAMLAMAFAVVEWFEANVGYRGLANEVIVEFQQIYQAAHKVKQTDNNSLLPLACIDGMIIALFAKWAKPTRYRPAEWKQQMNGDVTIARVKSRLSTDEARLVTEMEKRAKSLSHNAIDSAGIGLFHTGRLAPRRVFNA